MSAFPVCRTVLPSRQRSVSAWSVCDTAPTRGPPATVPGGDIDRGSSSPRRAGRADAVLRQAVLVTHKGASYVIWGGERSQIDPTDRSVTFNLGLDPGVTYPVEISNALFDAMPATEPLVMPAIPEPGTPSTVAAGINVGSVLETRDSSGQSPASTRCCPTGCKRSPASLQTCCAPRWRRPPPRRRSMARRTS